MSIHAHKHIRTHAHTNIKRFEQTDFYYYYRTIPTPSFHTLFLSLSDTHTHILSLPIKLLVEEEDEQVDVDFGLVEHLHDGNSLVLKLQQILWEAAVFRLGGIQGHRRASGLCE